MIETCKKTRGSRYQATVLFDYKKTVTAGISGTGVLFYDVLISVVNYPTFWKTTS